MPGDVFNAGVNMFTTCGEAWAAMVAFQATSFNLGYRVQDPATRPLPVVGEIYGRSALVFSYLIAGDTYEIYYVIQENAAGNRMPARYVLGQPGMQQFLGIPYLSGTDHPATDAANQARVYILDFKAAIIADLTDGDTDAVSWKSVDMEAANTTTWTRIQPVQSADQWYATVDGFRIATDWAGEDGRTDKYPTSLPGYAAQPLSSGTDLTETNGFLKDIALRDYTVRFNHGAQQFSASGGVAIP